MLDLLFGTWTGILSLGVLIVSVAIIAYLFYVFFFGHPKSDLQDVGMIRRHVSAIGKPVQATRGCG